MAKRFLRGISLFIFTPALAAVAVHLTVKESGDVELIRVVLSLTGAVLLLPNILNKFDVQRLQSVIEFRAKTAHSRGWDLLKLPKPFRLVSLDLFKRDPLFPTLVMFLWLWWAQTLVVMTFLGTRNQLPIRFEYCLLAMILITPLPFAAVRVVWMASSAVALSGSLLTSRALQRDESLHSLLMRIGAITGITAIFIELMS